MCVLKRAVPTRRTRRVPEQDSLAASYAAAAPPAPGAYCELPSGILWIRLPIPGALRHINVWLVPAPDGWFLVDTGMWTEDVEAAWLVLERKLPLTSDLRKIVVTHHHPDHFGMARWLAGRHDVPVYMTDKAGAASTAALSERAEEAPRGSDGFVDRLGLDLDEPMAAILRGGVYRKIVSGLPSLERLEADHSLSGADRDWQISVHSGHAPGHACLLDRRDGLLISGDQVLPQISSNVSLYPSNEEADPLGEYLSSLEWLARLPPDTLVLPAHGLPFSGLHARIEGLRAGHELRLDRIAAACTEPRSTMEIVAGLFPLQRLDPLNRLLATTETLAHLRYLELRDRVRREGSASSLRWLAG